MSLREQNLAELVARVFTGVVRVSHGYAQVRTASTTSSTIVRTTRPPWDATSTVRDIRPARRPFTFQARPMRATATAHVPAID